MFDGVALFSGAVVAQGGREQGHWARFAVKESYHGLPANTTEVVVYPGIWSGFTLGESYLLTAGPWKDFGPKPWTWERLEWWWSSERHQPPGLRLMSGECAYSRELREVSEQDWGFARAVREGTYRRRIDGRVFSAGRRWPGQSEWPTLPGATVRIQGKSKSWSVTTDANGVYSVDDVEPGKYRVEAEKSGYTSIWPTPELAVSTYGCGYGPITLTAAGRISGRVVHPDGSAAAGASVVYRSAGSPTGGRIASTTANKRGEFDWDDAPAGNLMLEARPANSNEPYSSMPVPLRRNEVRQGIVFRLNPTPPKRVITVRVRWPDGRLATGVQVHGHTDGSFTGRRTTGADGTAQLSLFSGHPYSVFASVQVDGRWTGAGARVEPHTDSVDLVIVKAPTQSR